MDAAGCSTGRVSINKFCENNVSVTSCATWNSMAFSYTNFVPRVRQPYVKEENYTCTRVCTKDGRPRRGR